MCIHPSVLWFIGNFSIHLPIHPSPHPACSILLPNPLLLRFVHELQRIHSSTTDQCNQVTAALNRVRQAREKGEALERKVGKERVVLGEKSEACEQLLVQVGQDTAISQEHSKLAAKQRSRIAHLRRVSYALLFGPSSLLSPSLPPSPPPLSFFPLTNQELDLPVKSKPNVRL